MEAPTYVPQTRQVPRDYQSVCAHHLLRQWRPPTPSICSVWELTNELMHLTYSGSWSTHGLKEAYFLSFPIRASTRRFTSTPGVYIYHQQEGSRPEEGWVSTFLSLDSAQTVL